MNQITRKDGIVYQRKKHADIQSSIPSKEQYLTTLNKLVTNGSTQCYLVLRLGCECGLSRYDIVNLETKNVDLKHQRSLWVETSKRVNRGTKEKPDYRMRSREVPLNQNLYAYIQTQLNPDYKYLVHKLRKRDVQKPYDVYYMNKLYEKSGVPWSTHISRHYFRTMVKTWMREQTSVDEELVDAFMGHKPRDARAHYGMIDWNYKVKVIDKVFE